MIIPNAEKTLDIFIPHIFTDKFDSINVISENIFKMYF